MKKQFKAIIPWIIIIIALVFLQNIVRFVVNVEWFKKVGYLNVYFTKLFAVLKIMIPIFFIIFFSILMYFNSIKKSLNKQRSIEGKSEIKKTNKIFIFVDIVISFIVSLFISTNYWYTILQFTNSKNFNIKDPIFNKDLSFYVFKMPLIESIYKLFMSLFIVLIVITFILYFSLYAKDNFFNRIKIKDKSNLINLKNGITKFAGRQLAIVSCLILILISLGYKIKAWDLVYSPRGVAFGASYTDVNVSLKFYRIITVLSFIAGIVVLVSILTSKVKPIIVSISIIVALIIIENVSAVFVQNFVVRSNEKTLEKKYIKYNINYTRKAFNLNNIDLRNFPIKNDLTINDLNNNKQTIENIKVNSSNQVLEYYNQLQVLKYYYKFKDMDVDRYKIKGKNTQVFLSAREIDISSLKNKASTWQNKHLTYTHGYGIVMNKVNEVTSSGKPDFIIKDIPIDNNLDVKLKNPRIYFGEETNDYAIVDTKIGELDYPYGNTNKTNNYSGTAGIKMNFINKIIMSIYEQNPKFLLSRDITSDSKIIINRNIVKRVKKIAPFLMYDKDPYIVINNGRLNWIIDAYTVSNRYPFSQPYNNINYIRNSVKVSIDAVDGTTNFYVIDKTDPLIKSYSKIFPGLFKDYDKMPENLKDHIKYPADLFNIQCNVLGKYHVTDPMVFYSGDDLWDISRNEKQVGNSEKEEKNPISYIVMKLPEEKKEEMVVTQYFNVNKKNNMEALLCGRMDGKNYGKLVLYRFNNEPVDSPYLFKQNIKQDANISKEIALWNQKGSGVIFGDTQIIPMKTSLLYIEPLYIRASGNDSIPQMKRVIVSYADKMIIAENIQKAFEKVFNITNNDDFQNQNATNIKNENNKDKIKDAKYLYDKALNAQKNGDWAKYGEYINSLGKLLDSLNK